MLRITTLVSARSSAVFSSPCSVPNKGCAAMEKLESAELGRFVEAARLTALRLLPPGKALLSLEAELSRAAEYLRQNVSVKHVLGMLSTYEMRNDL